jgi:excinuclease ABC subunit C
MKESVLDDIQGLGPGRRERLLKEFGSLTAVKKASLVDLKAISWLPDVVAENVHRAFHPGDERLETNELE